MIARDFTSWFYDGLPFQRKHGAWVLPSVVGLSIGMAAGVGIGLLIAPEPGGQTRRRLALRAEDLQRKASRLVDRARGEVVAKGHEIAGEARAELSRATS